MFATTLHRSLRGLFVVGIFICSANLSSPVLARAPQADLPSDFNQIVISVPTEGGIQVVSQAIAGEAVSTVDSEQARTTPERTTSKIHPLLEKEIAEEHPRKFVEVVVSFADDIHLPSFPDSIPGEPRDSARNMQARAHAEHLIQNIVALRKPRYEQRETELLPLHARVLETFWLIDAMLIEAPLEAIPIIASRPDVLAIQPNDLGDVPPQDAGNDVRDGRRLISSDYYSNFAASGYIGVLDTGMRFSHTLLSNPSRVRYQRDCVNGTSNNCATGSGLNPWDDCWNHGTSTGSIISGNSNQGDPFRGVTANTMDSFKVYDCIGLKSNAAIRGFQAAIGVLDKIIVAEIQAQEPENGAIALAADNAFDAGVAVIAANGNFGPASGTVRSPAIGHKVIGVGAYDVMSGSLEVSSGRGPATDGRIKPDLIAPTNTETASNADDIAHQVFGGTSGATPYASGAAALLRNWLASQGGTIAPGQIYAQLILASGRTTQTIDNNAGAGAIQLYGPSETVFWRGSTILSNNQILEIPLSIQALSDIDLAASAWWPEAYGQQHNNIDISLVDPSGAVRATSAQIPSVFERAAVNGSLAGGTWKLRLHGISVTGSQTVFWAAKATRLIGG